MEVLGTAGDASLGGNDFDARLADWLLAECAARDGGGSSGGAADPGQLQWAMAAAEAAKIAMAGAESAEVALPGGGAPLALTQHRFEELSSDLFQLMANVLEALGDALFIEWAVKPSDAVPGRPAASASSNGNSSSGSGSSSGGGGGSSIQEGGGGQRDRWAPPPRRITQVALVGQVTRLPSVQRFVRRITGGLCCWTLLWQPACRAPVPLPWLGVPPACVARPPTLRRPAGSPRAGAGAAVCYAAVLKGSNEPGCRRGAAADGGGPSRGSGARCCHPRGRAAGRGAPCAHPIASVPGEPGASGRAGGRPT